MHALFRSSARSSSKITLSFLLMWVPLLPAQNTPVQLKSNQDLPDAPMPVTTAPPTSNNLNFARGTVTPRFDANRSQAASWMSPVIQHPALNTNSFATKDGRSDRREMKVAGKPAVNWFGFDPPGGHPNRTATHNSAQWYTNHIPWAGGIMRQGLKISKAHPHLTTVIKTLKPRL